MKFVPLPKGKGDKNGIDIAKQFRSVFACRGPVEEITLKGPRLRNSSLFGALRKQAIGRYFACTVMRLFQSVE